MRRRITLTIVVMLIGAAFGAVAAQIGDAGHFIDQFPPDVFLNSPDGEAFSVTVHRYIWPVDHFNGGTFKFELSGPDDKPVAAIAVPMDKACGAVRVAAGAKGVYRLRGRLTGYGLCWFESSLDQMVAHCGDIGLLVENTPGYRPFMLHAVAPRRWYFYVPPGVEEFEIQHVMGTWQSRREDYGFVVMNPRGQRVAALYGGVAPKRGRLKKPEVVSRKIETDAGTTGRFWSIWVTGGDSHCYSDMRIVLKGVPPYLAPTPEQWFDPSTGKVPQRLVYDESQIRHIDEKAKADPKTGKRPTTDLYLWTPSPYLGDEDFNGFRGGATVYLDNPENRQITFGAGSYLPVNGNMPVQYTLTDPSGQEVFRQSKDFVHRGRYDVTIPARGNGIYRMDVDAAAWYAWSEPAVPMVLAGERTCRGSRFHLQLSVARHWFFKVPAGTKRFSVSARVENPDHVLSLEIHAPDRLMYPLHVRGGRRAEKVKVVVPVGLDGKIWFLRTDVGSPTRFTSTDRDSAGHVRIDADITLRGVPGYLAPTWGQWFDPR